MAKKKATKTTEVKPETSIDKTLAEDALKYIEYEAVESEWFVDHSEGWEIVNRLRAAMGRPKIKPIDMPSCDYFDSDGEIQ